MSITKIKSKSLQRKLCKFLSGLLVIMSLQASFLPLFAHASDNGYWNNVEIIPYPISRSADGVSRTGTVSDGSATYDFSTDDGNNTFKTSASWSGINSSYSAGEEIAVTLNLKIDDYVNGGAWNFVDDHIYANFNGTEYLVDENGGYSFYCNGEYGEAIVPAVTKTVRATFGTGSSYGERTSLYVGTAGGQVEYVFEWQENAAAAKPSPSPTPLPSPTYAPIVPSPSPSEDPDDSGVRFASLNGQVDITYSDEKHGEAAEYNTVIKVGAIIYTQEDSSAILTFGDMSTFVLKENSKIIITAPPERDGKLKIVAGNIWINIKKMLKDGSMEVETNQAVCGIKGTTFTMEVTDDGTTLKLLEGTVAFTSKTTGETVDVSTGEMASADDYGLSEVTAFDVAEEEESWREFDLPSVAAAPGSPALIVILSAAALAVIIFIVSILLSRRADKRRQSSRMQMPAQIMNNGYSPPYNAPAVQPAQYNARIFCSNCGTPLGATDRFCPKCGHARAR